MTTTRWRDITHKPTCRDASRYEFLLPTDPQMPTQTDEQVVRQKYPFASVTHCSHIWEIWRNEKHEGNYYDGRLGYSGDSQSKAWADARSKLPTDPQNREQARDEPEWDLMPMASRRKEVDETYENREQAPESSKPSIARDGQPGCWTAGGS